MVINLVAVEKLLSAKFAKTKLRQDSPTNDSLSFLDIFHPPSFDRLGGNWTFSTPTLYFTNNPVVSINAF
jgi:hypothetical protein